MKRVLQKEVINELSKLVLGSVFVAGDTIYIDSKGKGLTFSKEPFEGAAPVPAQEEEAEETEAEAGKEQPAPKKEPAATENGNKEEEDKKARERKKQLAELEKATKELEDAVKDAKKEEGKKKK